jgi:hypothetical protein
MFKLPTLNEDKANHVLYGIAISAIVLAITHSAVPSFFITAGVAMGREQYSYIFVQQWPQYFNWRDALATVAGAMITLILAQL